MPHDAPKPPGYTRFVCVSDTHSRTDPIQMPYGDVLIHAGDFTELGLPSEVKKFNEWLGRCWAAGGLLPMSRPGAASVPGCPSSLLCPQPLPGLRLPVPSCPGKRSLTSGPGHSPLTLLPHLPPRPSSGL